MDRMRNSFKIMLIGNMLLFFTQHLFAQNLTPGDTTYNKWQKCILNIRSVYIRKDQPSVKDTLSGTAFLLTDQGKIYMVTTKKLLQRDIYGKDQQLANDSVFVRLDYKKYINLIGLSGAGSDKSAVIFSNDNDDIAVISLQKKAYKRVLAQLLLIGTKPVPVGLLDTSNEHHADELLMRFAFLDYPGEKNTLLAGKRVMGSSLQVSQIAQYESSASIFTIKSPERAGIFPGNNGAPIVANDRLIGMLRNPTGMESNREIIQNPNYILRSGQAVKAAYILRCLHKLQMIENSPNFDN